MLHVSPMNPWAQLQVKLLMSSAHSPLFIQGFDLHSSISDLLETFKAKLCLIPRIMIYDLSWNYQSLLLSQFVPAKPKGHLHLYDAIPSMHVPSLKQGLALQSSISENYLAVIWTLWNLNIMLYLEPFQVFDIK